MDPVTHTFVGATLGAAGLRRATPLAVTTLIAGANAPDVDIVTLALGPYDSLALRRGITHGIPALFVLPLLVAGAVLAWDRWVRRRLRPSAPPARPLPVLGLAGLGVWTHPPLDWLNEYGMRWLLPFDGRWSYGDAVFIIDPWVWLALGGALFVVHSRRPAAIVFWATLAAAMSMLVLGVAAVPPAAKIVWVAGLLGWIVVRAAVMPASRPEEGERTARFAAGAAGLYLLLMVIQAPIREAIVTAEARGAEIGPIEEVMVGPIPANPFRGRVIVSTPAAYWWGEFRWTPRPEVRFRPGPVERPPPDRHPIPAVLEHPDARSYLVWSRFPVFRMDTVPEGWRVRILDARYMGRESAELEGPTIIVDREPPPGTR